MLLRSYVCSYVSSVTGLQITPRNAVQQSSSVLCLCSSSKVTMICWSAPFCCLKRLQSLIQSNNPLPRPSLLRMRCLCSVTVTSPAIDHARATYVNDMPKIFAPRDFILECGHVHVLYINRGERDLLESGLVMQDLSLRITKSCRYPKWASYGNLQLVRSRPSQCNLRRTS